MTAALERRRRFADASQDAIAAGVPLLVGIDIAALRSNLERITARLAGRQLCAVVKGDAYGHGIENVAPAMSEHTNFFAIVDNEEARRVRLHVHNAELLRLRTAARHEIAASLREGLPIREPTATIEHAEMLGWESRRHGCQVAIDLPIDVTGLGREGVSVSCPASLRAFLSAVAKVEGLRIASLSCHLVPRGEATVAGQKAALLDELESFLAVASGFIADCERSGRTKPQLSAFSTSTSSVPELVRRIDGDRFVFFDRLGNDLFGSVSSSAIQDAHGAQVMTVVSFVSDVFHRRRGETIGYERLYNVASADGEEVGLAPIGWSTYGREYQGVGKARKPGFVVSWDGEPYALLGRQSMNISTIAVSSRRARLSANQQILFLSSPELLNDRGAAPTVSEVAHRMGDVQHEFVTTMFGLARSAARFVF